MNNKYRPELKSRRLRQNGLIWRVMRTRRGGDGPLAIWPFREWVIEAIHCDQPFDQFTIEQLAGAMLPDATPI